MIPSSRPIRGRAKNNADGSENLMREAYRQGVAQAMSQFGIET
ncbi:hypothetical protein BIFDEN_02293 [Bifidobacterium dentium ATCC 27678]|uniref:Uncharacterized protein n=1 Tax=Bifidobacterium dentium (strain ATCC 27534 / DSM 20436 / JCM 1195 / Bd1) TaxID=401473 RepID=D2Q9U7_BIFDB|nr:Hypothetical protein BDP_0935 [Bifidobacterium dentium Bd1]EDT46441.1 hypothetical protein BIFDEN_02293 [Bifidobacterium dentium ATCC 27678]BAQ26887.1 hypothetical protein BBDE_0893 [Bifidobacterium dentium JCM 1195 = DSM 20436]